MSEEEQKETSQEATPETKNKEASESSQSTQENQPKMVTIEVPENWEYNGDRNNVPEPLKKYAKSFDRYASKKDQALAETKKQLEEYERIINSPQFQQFQQQFSGQPQQQQPQKQQQQPFYTQEELEAISMGDGKALQNVIDRAVDAKLQNTVGTEKKAFEEKIAGLTQKQKELEYGEQIREFSKLNPDFQDLLESPIGDVMIAEAKRGESLENIYAKAKEIENHMAERIQGKKKEDLDKKKKGSTVKNTVSGTPDVVWADDDNHARRLAIELQLKNDNRQVRIKPKK